ncbi:hypothetical protein RY27_28935 [Litorilinea aerophila]|uniref:MFS transporter n=1 Tax=Litorilinea aerophila TaxID=1204385 RepID=A0A540VNE7_9CHLR|nr:hypothetical protein RY27_28935 [Litorilinea aerophila]
MHVSVSIAKGSPVQKAVPAEYRARFLHLYWDIAWFGILAGSSMAFLSVYAARLGADAFQIGLLNAGPAAVGLLFTMPAGHWLRRRSVGKAVFWSAVAGRIHYLWWIFLPLLLPAQSQIWLFILLVLLMTIPGTVLAVGFNALYAAAVPPEWRSHVVGIRNALLSLVYVATSLLCGYILDHTPLHTGYAIIFGLGFVGAVMSTVHLWFLRQTTPEEQPEEEAIRAPLGDFARPGHIRLLGLNLRTAVGLRAFTRGRDLLRLEVLQGRYGRVVAAMFAFHFAQYLPIPIFPLYWVEQLHFNDGSISLGTAAFHLAVLLGSLQLARLSQWWGNHRLTVVGALLLSSYPLLTAFTPGLGLFLVTSLIGGVAWSMVGGSLGNYLLEQIPPTDRPAYLAWYNLALNAAILLGSLSGSLLAEVFTLSEALLVAFVLRLAAGLALWQWR